MTMRYDSISHRHFNYTLFQEIRKECATKARLTMTTYFRLYTIWPKKYKLSDEESRKLYRSVVIVK